jgi:hypothetical protein
VRSRGKQAHAWALRAWRLDQAHELRRQPRPLSARPSGWRKLESLERLARTCVGKLTNLSAVLLPYMAPTYVMAISMKLYWGTCAVAS